MRFRCLLTPPANGIRTRLPSLTLLCELPQRRYEQVRCPRGSGIVQFFVVPSCVIATFAVVDPS